MDQEAIINYFLTHGVNILISVVVLVFGIWAARLVKKLFIKSLKGRHLDITIKYFLANIIYILLLIVVLIIVFGQLGIPTASLITVLGAAGLAIGLALQGSLSNVAAGLLIIFLRPFKIGDFLDVGGVTGTVEKITIFHTLLLTPNNEVVIFPNAKLTADKITNKTAKSNRRIDVTIGISYESDLVHAKQVLFDILKEDDRILADPTATVAVKEHADSAINFAVRPWVKKDDYVNVMFALLEKIKLRFDLEKIEIPYPQLDVHSKPEPKG